MKEAWIRAASTFIMEPISKVAQNVKEQFYGLGILNWKK